MKKPTLAVIGLGANLGDPIQQLLNARAQLVDLAIDESLRCSHFYLSSPVGFDDQPYFVNAVAAFNTSLSAHDLLDKLQSIENDLGRQRDPNNQNAARAIDLDILLYGDQRINDARLIVPHPRMTQRLFVLAPLAEIEPSAKVEPSAKIEPSAEVERQMTANDLIEKSDFSNQELFKLSL